MNPGGIIQPTAHRPLLTARCSLLYSPTKVVENATMRLTLSYKSTARRAYLTADMQITFAKIAGGRNGTWD